MEFPIGHLFSIRSFLLAGAQTCLLLENGLMVSCKGQKEQILMSKQGFSLLSILISNAIQLKGKQFEKNMIFN